KGTPPSSAGSPFNYTITLTGGCGITTVNGSILVNPPGALVLTSLAGTDAQTVCATSAISNITYSVSGISGASASGLPAGVVLTPSPGVLTISGTPSATGTFNYTITTTGGCGAGSATGIIIVHPPLTAGAIASIATCSGTNGLLTLSGNSDIPTMWQYSLDSTSSTWTDIFNTTTTQAFSNITVPTFYRAEISNTCGTIWTAIATVQIHNYWVGGTAAKPNDWNTPGNWSDNKVPSVSCDEVFIPAAVYNPILNDAPIATIKDLHILSGGVLTISATGLLQISGTISNAGLLDVTDGSIEFNGTSGGQPIDGNLFKNHTVKNLVVSNNVNVAATANDTLNISGNLNFGSASSVLNTGNNITLKSNANSTANIGPLADANSINGNVTVERYINTGPGKHAKAWEFLATPVKGQSVHDSWMEKGLTPAGYGTQITGTGTGFDLSSPAPSMKYYDLASSTYWTGITNTGNEIYNAHGYMLFVRGDRTVNGSSVTTANPTILRITGQLNQHQQSIAAAATSFTAVGNPFASAIDMRKIMADKSANVDDFFTIWNSNDAGNYGYGKYYTYLKSGTDYISVPGDGSVNNYIQSGQAFFVQNTGATAGSMIFNETSKATANSGFLTVFRPAGANGKDAQLRTNLYSISASNKILLDGTLQQFNDRFANSIDGFDGRKVFNSSENLSIVSGGKQLIVERRKFPITDDTVFYSVTSLKVGNYRFEFIAQNLSGANGFLEDTYLKTQTPVNPEGKTIEDFAVTSDAGSFAATRFRIIYKTMAALPVTIVSFTGDQENNVVHLHWQVTNEININKYQLEKSLDANHFSLFAERPAVADAISATYLATDESPAVGTNYYRLKIVDNNGKYTYSQVIKVQVAAQKSSISVFPNPITDGIIRLQFLNQPKGKYIIRLMNNLGQLIMQKQMVFQEENFTVPVNWNYNLSKGIYQLQVVRPDGSIKELKVLY
ncbi:MAG: T9SS type A sorting domain-containing protein, partial [Ferruginibacter sp.]